MESDKKKIQSVDYSFDLEEELKDVGKLRALKEQIEERISQLKILLRKGENKKKFDQSQTLLHGYLALQKVVQRVNRKVL
ncbi:MAG: DUF5398 family protein [Chlamydiales bacterium]